MTPLTIATIAARMLGAFFLLQAMMYLPAIYTAYTIPSVTAPSFETTAAPGSPSYERDKRHAERMTEMHDSTMAKKHRDTFLLWFYFAWSAIVGMSSICCSRKIGYLLCKGLNTGSDNPQGNAG